MREIGDIGAAQALSGESSQTSFQSCHQVLISLIVAIN